MLSQNSITAFTQVCRKRRLKGGLECKLMLMFCVGIMHANLFNCIKFRTECNIWNYLILHSTHVVDARKDIQSEKNLCSNTLH